MIRNLREKTITAALFLLLFCSGILSCFAEDSKEPLLIVTIWNAPYVPGSELRLDFSDAPHSVQVQRRGFEKGMLAAQKNNFQIDELMISEQDDFEEVIEDLANVYNNNYVLMSIGASSDINTMYTAMETSFFNVSYLIPFSDGDLLSESSKSYTARLTVSGEKYANYIGNELLPVNSKEIINKVLFEDKQVPDYSISAAVFFQDNYNDHETAVRISQRLMDNGINIEYHTAYPSGRMMDTIEQCMNDEIGLLPDIDVVILIGEDHDPMPQLPDILNLWKDRQYPPAIIAIGYDPDTVSSAVANADNIYFLEQSLDRTKCPADVVTNGEAMGYAAGYLMMEVLDESYRSQPAKPSGLRFKLMTPSQKQNETQKYWEKFRQDISSKLLGFTDYIPCYGYVRLNSSSGNTATLELLRFDSSKNVQKVNPSEIIERILTRKRAQFGIWE